MKNIKFIILLLFLYNCGYSSIYKYQKFINFKMEIIKVEGDDNEMNNLIKNEIRLYSNKDSTDIYKLNINTDYKKEALTKNSEGDITDYNLSVTAKFQIDFLEKTQTVQFKENINIKNLTDRFEQNAYETNIKRNFASSIREKLISAIININDN